ncbi:hypothetical protein [Nonomuraea sp. NPDC002799]
MDPSPYSWKFYLSTTIGVLWTIVLVALIASRATMALTIVTVVVGIVGVVGPVLGIYGVRALRVPKINPRHARRVIGGIIAVNALVSATWAAVLFYQANRDVDIRAVSRLSGQTNVRPGGVASLAAALPARRGHVVLTFRIADHNEEIGYCAPFTTLTVRPRADGNAALSVTRRTGEQMRLDIAPGATELHLDIIVSSVRNDANCAVDLSLTEAVLTNS